MSARDEESKTQISIELAAEEVVLPRLGMLINLKCATSVVHQDFKQLFSLMADPFRVLFIDTSMTGFSVAAAEPQSTCLN